MSKLLLQLKLLEDKQKRSGVKKTESKGYSVYYGWTKIMQNTVYVRRQTPDEEKDFKV